LAKAGVEHALAKQNHLQQPDALNCSD